MSPAANFNLYDVIVRRPAHIVISLFVFVEMSRTETKISTTVNSRYDIDFELGRDHDMYDDYPVFAKIPPIPTYADLCRSTSWPTVEPLMLVEADAIHTGALPLKSSCWILTGTGRETPSSIGGGGVPTCSQRRNTATIPLSEKKLCACGKGTLCTCQIYKPNAYECSSSLILKCIINKLLSMRLPVLICIHTPISRL